ncbi:hypothetical protein [Nonomuraea sp. NPDC003804]|uniref:hypothetical protein n=1 Tax=Nonomuraea sp. NPDC003804 TaxID=3154547 RepID=UPI0033A7CE28
MRDTLAGVPDARLADLAERWGRIEEFFTPPDTGYLVTLIGELRELARRAQADGQLIYCWWCL